MIAFVLSGGGNRGALEVGALQALLEAGIQPDMLVGTSAGAMNAAFIATDPSLTNALRLADHWIEAARARLFPGNLLTFTWRFITGQNSLYPNDHILRFVEQRVPPGKSTFGDLPVRLYITAANLDTATLYLFGDDPSARLLDAVMASTAVPGLLPPLVLGGWQYVDGGVVANVPISIAVAKGAKIIYAINVGYAGKIEPPAHGVYPIAWRAITTMLYQQLLNDLEEVAALPAVMLHHIPIGGFEGVPLPDFSKSAEMIREGYRVTKDYLAHPRVPGQPLNWPAFPPPAPPPRGAKVWPRR